MRRDTREHARPGYATAATRRKRPPTFLMSIRVRGSRHPSRHLDATVVALCMTPISAVIFDMDGILIDTEPIWRRVEIEVFGRLGLHLTEEQCVDTMGLRVPEIVALWYSRHPWNGLSPGEVTQSILAGLIESVRREGEPLPGVRDTLETIRALGLRIGLASSSSMDVIEAVLDRLQIASYFEVICTGDDEAEGKPHPAVYLRAAERLRVPPERCLAIEDSPNGVVAARAAGMYCVAIPDPHLAQDQRFEQANLRLDSLSQITPKLLRDIATDVPAVAGC